MNGIKCSSLSMYQLFCEGYRIILQFALDNLLVCWHNYQHKGIL
jgi:hypothetical protein